MAELALKIGAGSNYLDGDILCAFNSRAIRCTHAQHICHVRQAGGGAGVLRDDTHVARDWFEHTHKYRFERISLTEIKRILLSDMSEEVFSNTPRRVDGKAQHMDVESYVARRLNHEGHKIFGTPGAEVWYGGRTDVSDTVMTLVWNSIETKTAFREIDFPLWPAGVKDLLSHLFITVDDFDEAAASDLVSPELDETDPENPITIKKRQRHMNWRDEVPTREHADIENSNVKVDLRETMTPLVRGDTVKTRV